MSEVVSKSRGDVLAVDLRMVAAGTGALVLTIGLSLLLANQTGEMLTRNTVRLSLAWYSIAFCLMFCLGPADWTASTRLGRVARWCWTLSLVTFLVHLMMAFHFYHHWSHADAFNHTAEMSGIGEGIYVSYLFTLLWIVDVAWWWIQPLQFATRSVWIDRTLHAFMLFIVFNGTVIYERGPIRWAALAVFAALAIAWRLSRQAKNWQPA